MALWDDIKEYMPSGQTLAEVLPALVGAGVGAAVGGAPGALAAAGGVGQAEEAQTGKQQAAAMKLMELRQKQQEIEQTGELKKAQIENTKAYQEMMQDYRTQSAAMAHLDRQDRLKEQQTLGEENIQTRRDIAAENLRGRKEIAAENDATRRLIASTEKSNAPPTEEEFNTWLKGEPPEVQNAYKSFGASPAMRLLAVKSAASYAMLNSPSVANEDVKRILKYTPGMDPDEATEIAMSMDPKRRHSVAMALEAGELKASTGKQLRALADKDAKADAVSRSKLAADLEKQAKAYDGLGIANRLLVHNDKAKYIVDHLDDSAWAGLSPGQKARAKRDISHALTIDKTEDYDSLARHVFPEDRVPSRLKTSVVPDGGDKGTTAALKSKSGRPIALNKKTGKYEYTDKDTERASAD